MHRGFPLPPNRYQVYRSDVGSYQYLVHPLPPQQLQELYPGKLMSNQWHYTGDNIPNEDPEGLEYTKSRMSALARAAAMEEEALARHLGGKHHVARHPAVTPEATIEDPDLRSLSVRDLPNPNPAHVKSQLPSMEEIRQADVGLSASSRAESHRAEQVARMKQETGLPGRDFRENFCLAEAPNVHPFSPGNQNYGGHPPDFVTPRNAPPYFREGFDLEKDIDKNEDGKPLWMWLALGGGIILFLIIMGIIIFAIMKKKH